MTALESYNRVTTLSEVTSILNVACSSARIQKLQVDRPESGLESMRPQIHLFLSAPKASFKSSMLTKAQSFHGGVYQIGITYPALVGTVDKNSGELTDSLAWNARDSILFVDEFVSAERKDQLIKAFLPLLTEQTYTRSIGLKSIDKSSSSHGNYYRVHKGRIELKVRFAGIFASMYSLKMFAKYISHEALLDRCIPIQYEVTNENRDDVARGKAIFNFEPYACPKEVTIDRKDFERVYAFWKEKSVKDLDVRALDDCLRVFAVTQEHQNPIYRFVIESHNELDLIKEEIEKERVLRIERSQQRYYG